MDKLNRKLIGSFVILALLMAAFGVFSMMNRSVINLEKEIQKTMEMKIESINEAIYFNEFVDLDSMENYEKNNTIKVGLSAGMLKHISIGEEDDLVGSYGNGHVIRIHDGTYDAPESFTDDIANELRNITEEEGHFNTVRQDDIYEYYYAHVRDDYYYIESYPDFEMMDYLISNSIDEESFKNIEKAHDVCYAVILNPQSYEGDADSEYFMFYASDELEADSVLKNCRTYDDVMALDETESDDGGSRYFIRELDDTYSVLLKVETEDIARNLMLDNLWMMICIAIFSIVFIVLIMSTLRFVRDHTLTDEQKGKYNPLRLKKTALSYGILTLVILFLISIFFDASRNVQKETAGFSSTLEAMIYRINSSVSYNEQISDKHNQVYIGYGREIYDLMKSYPELESRSVLAECSKEMNARYIILYDADGRETAASNDMIGLSLGGDDSSSTAPFRRLLNGVDHLVLTDMDDPYLGRTKNVIGIRLDRNDGRYGVMLIGLDSMGTEDALVSDRNVIMDQMTNSASIAFCTDKESGIITNSSEFELIGLRATDAGITEEELKDNTADFFHIDGEQYYGLSMEEGNSIYYYMTTNESIFQNLLPFSLSITFVYLIIFAILYVYMMHGYTDEVFEEYSAQGDYMIRHTRNVYAPERLRREYSLEKNHSLLQGMRWKELFPDQKAIMVFNVLFGITLAVLLVQSYHSDASVSKYNILDYLIFGNWTRGFNLFAIASIILLGAIMLIAMMIIRMIFRMLFNIQNTRAATISHLVLNVIRYVIAFVFLYYAFSYLGFDASAVLLSAGIVTFTVSFGAKDIVTDMLSGILIIFEGDFEVGDIIEVANFRGTVMEIGMRSTKLIGNGNNIKTIPNHEVKNVLNLTRLNSWYTLQLKIPNDISIVEVENMLETELPKMKRKIPEIINGPEYKGVINIGGGFMTILIIAEYDEDDYYKVQRKLNREIMLLFNEKGIRVL